MTGTANRVQPERGADDARESAPAVYLSAKRSARHLGVSVSFFRAQIARAVRSADFATPGSRKRLPRWRITDLDRWAASMPAV